jgi:hypothetical protein
MPGAKGDCLRLITIKCQAIIAEPEFKCGKTELIFERGWIGGSRLQLKKSYVSSAYYCREMLKLEALLLIGEV